MFYDTKIVIKGKSSHYDENAESLEFEVSTKGDERYIFDMLTATLISMAIEYDISKKDLVDYVKRNYEVIFNERNDRNEN